MGKFAVRGNSLTCEALFSCGSEELEDDSGNFWSDGLSRVSLIPNNVVKHVSIIICRYCKGCLERGKA